MNVGRSNHAINAHCCDAAFQISNQSAGKHPCEPESPDSAVRYKRPMTDEYQIEIPPSFYALYTDARRRLTAPMALVRERYEACEDLAQMLVDPAATKLFELGVAQEDVLLRFHAGLCTAGSAVSVPEAEWVIRRLAELLGWACPPLATCGGV